MVKNANRKGRIRKAAHAKGAKYTAAMRYDTAADEGSKETFSHDELWASTPEHLARKAHWEWVAEFDANRPERAEIGNPAEPVPLPAGLPRCVQVSLDAEDGSSMYLLDPLGDHLDPEDVFDGFPAEVLAISIAYDWQDHGYVASAERGTWRKDMVFFHPDGAGPVDILSEPASRRSRKRVHAFTVRALNTLAEEQSSGTSEPLMRLLSPQYREIPDPDL